MMSNLGEWWIQRWCQTFLLQKQKVVYTKQETGNEKQETKSGGYKDGAKLFITKIESSIHRKGNKKQETKSYAHALQFES